MSHFVRTYKRRKIFLDQLAVGSSISFAAHAAGGTTKNFNKWKEADADFASDWDEALEEGTDFIEDAATDRALKKSDPLMAMILKARRPEKYDRGSKLELSGGISVEGSKQKLLNRIARLQAASVVQQGGPAALDALPGLDATLGEEVEAQEARQLEAPRPAEPAPVRGRKRRAAAGLSD